MIEIAAQPYVPGWACGVVSRDPRQPGAILVTDRVPLPPDAHPAGVVVVDGAPFSHPMLSLLAHGVPVVIVTAGQAQQLANGETIALDGAHGRLCSGAAGPPPAEPRMPERVETADGIPLEFCASVRDATGALRARVRGAAAIGLVRSEFLAPADGRMPDRAFYENEFARLAEAAAPLPVTVRLVDVAADKHPPWLAVPAAPGRQGVRLYDREPLQTVLEAQLAALAALSGRYALRLLLPYVTRPDEARVWRERIRQRMAVPVGAMAETPAAALDVAALLTAADFVALGLNDLMQCLFGADRDDPAARRYLDPYAPVLHRFLAETARLAQKQVGQVLICGLLAQLPGVLPVLIGLGFRRFSVDPVFLPWLAQSARATRSLKAATLAAEVCHARDSDGVRRRLGIGPAPA